MTEEQMKELEESRHLIEQCKNLVDLGNIRENIEQHQAKYTTPQDKLRDAWDELADERYDEAILESHGKETLFEDFKSHFSDFLLTPEKEAELKAEGWNEALDAVHTHANRSLTDPSYYYVPLSKIKQLRKPTKGE